MQLWVERNPSHPFTKQYLQTLSQRVMLGSGCMSFDRVIIRVMDPASASELGIQGQPNGSGSTWKPQTPFLTEFLAALHAWEGEVFVLPWVTMGTPWKGVRDTSDDPSKQAVFWAKDINKLAKQRGHHPINGVVFEEEGSGYFPKTSFDVFSTSIHNAMLFPQPSDPPLKAVFAPNTSARTVIQETTTTPWDELILQLYNLVGQETQSNWWKCNSALGGTDASGENNATCKLVASMVAESKAKGAPSPWQGVDTATAATFSDEGAHFLGYPNGSYLQAVDDPCALADYFNWFLLVNHSGTRSNAYFPPTDIKTDTKFSYLVSVECQGSNCKCRNTTQPPTAKAKQTVGCGVIDAFNTWGRDHVVRFTQSLAHTSGAKMGLFQYNVIPDSWW